MINKKYLPNDKNEGIVPEMPIIGTDPEGKPIYDERVLYVNVPCGQCIECRKQKARNWQVRLQEELKCWTKAYFITLTFDPGQLAKLLNKTGLTECNAAAAYAVRHSLERYRKDHGKSLRHWYITELGHEGTERIHLHGIIFTCRELEFVKTDKDDFYKWKYWKYGMVYVGKFCNEMTINYIVKYMHKIDEDHKGFIGQVLASPGIGRSYMEKPGIKNLLQYRPNETIDTYRLPNGARVKLPKYYSNKALSEEERELKWREFMDSKQESVMGNNYYPENIGNSTMANVVEKAQDKNKEYGYGDDSKEWRKKPFNVTKAMLQRQRKLENEQKMAAALRAKNYQVAQNLIKMTK